MEILNLQYQGVSPNDDRIPGGNVFYFDFDQKYLEFGPENFRIFRSSCETLKNEVLADFFFDLGVPYPYPIM